MSDPETTTVPHLPATAALVPGRGGQPRLLVDAPAGGGEIYLHGAHLTSWRPRGGKEVLFTSRAAIFNGSDPIRGGVPICAPWFAQGPDGERTPAHGLLRIQQWRLRSVTQDARGAVTALLSCQAGGVAALYEVTLGEELSLMLSLRVTAPEPQTLEAALHTYLAVGDVTAVTIQGLDAVGYWDKVTGLEHVQSGDIRFKGPTDRVYDSGAPVTVRDPAMGRRIVVTGLTTTDTVVWNPWGAGAAAMTDMADEEWPTFVCVESARVRQHALRLDPGQSLSVGARLRVEPLD